MTFFFWLYEEMIYQGIYLNYDLVHYICIVSSNSSKKRYLKNVENWFSEFLLYMFETLRTILKEVDIFQYQILFFGFNNIFNSNGIYIYIYIYIDMQILKIQIHNNGIG